MGTFMLGRIGVDYPGAGDVDGWSESGSRVTVSGHSSYGSVEDALVLRAQFMGLVDGADELFVPLVWSERPESDGFYRVLDVRFDSDEARAPFGVLDWRIELERVHGHASPLIELGTLGKTRTNSQSITTEAVQALCVPGAADSVAFYTTTFVPFSPDLVRASATGDVKVYRRLPTLKFLTQYFVAPDAFYDGAASLYMGDTTAVTVGRQIRNTPDRWILSNGLLEIMPVESDDFDLRFRMWVDGAWSAWVTFTMVAGQSSRSPMATPHSITVMRNTPEEVVIRLLTTAGTAEYSPVTVDLSLKRGSRFVGVELRSVFTGLFGLRCSAFTSATEDDPFYLWKTIGDVRMFITAPYGINQVSVDVHPYEISVSMVSAWSFGVGMVEGADADDNVTHSVYEYFFAGSSSQEVVAQ